MASDRVIKVNKELSFWDYKVLHKFHHDPRGRLGSFVLDKLHEADDSPQFHFLLRLPKCQGGPRRICLTNIADLPTLLHKDRLHPHKSMWFWLVQLKYYGLYELSVHDDIKRKVIRRCRRILRKELRNGSLTVPAAIRKCEEELRATQTHEAAEEDPTEMKKASSDHGDEIDTTPAEVLEEVLHNEADKEDTNLTLKNHSPTACNTAVQAHDEDEDDGDTSSVDNQFLNHRVQSEAADCTHTDDGNTNDESMPDSMPDFRDGGKFSNAEVEVLHNWRDAFCMQHNITRTEFQVMMTESCGPGNTEWTCEFITNPEFVDSYCGQLPIRDRGSMLRFRGRHNWNLREKGKLVRPLWALTLSQKRRRSRLSIIDGDNDEEDDAEEAEILSTRETIEDADIWKIRATEPLSDDDSEDQGLCLDQYQEQHSCQSTSRQLHENQCSPSRAISTQSQGPHKPSEQGEGVVEADSDIHMADATLDDSETDDESCDENEASYSKAISGDCTGNLKVGEESAPEQEIDSTSGEIQRASTPAESRGAPDRVRTTHTQSINESVDVFSIPSSPPQPKLPESMSVRSSIDPPTNIPHTPTRGILRNKSSPRRPRSPRPQLEEFMNTYQDLPVASLKSSMQTHPLQAMKRIAGNYGILFTQLSQIEQEDELDDFVEYVSKYVQKTSEGAKNEAIGVADHTTQPTAAENTRVDNKRRRSVENNGEMPENEGAKNSPQLEIGDLEGQKLDGKNTRKTKRRKSESAGPDGEVDTSDDKLNTPVTSTSILRASSLQVPTLALVRGIARSASHLGTPSDSQPCTPQALQIRERTSRPGYVLKTLPNKPLESANTVSHGETALYSARIRGPGQKQTSPTDSITTSSTAITTTSKSGHVDTQVKRSNREASFEFPAPVLPRSGPPIQNLANAQGHSCAITTKKYTPLVVDPIDRNKPYGSQENPQIIPATPQLVRTVKLAIKDEPRGVSLPPIMSARNKDQLKESKSESSKPSRPSVPRYVTPCPVRLSSTFDNPTPPSVFNQGVHRLSDLRLGQSYSQSPSFTEAMREDDRLFGRNQAGSVNNPTRNPLVQALVANASLNDHNLATFNSDGGEGQENVRVKRPQNDMLSRQQRTALSPQKQLYAEYRSQKTKRLSSGGGSQQSEQGGASGSTSSQGNYNLGIPGVWRNILNG